MKRTPYGSERAAHLCTALLGLLIMIRSASYGLGTPAKPGSGMYPFVIGLLILPLALFLFFSSLKGTKREAILKGREAGIFVSFIGVCALWILAMPYLGYPVVTLIATFLISKVMRLEGWLRPLILSAGTALFIYLLFDFWLYIDLPRGPWG